ncbi:signal recognition particle 14 kDa protein [Folsomia candida]|uniref:Signal recognition particle 14 kDa protein n=1 Tax=Folsomia candida TaxID=158441 RepID=A0A226DBY1_FOLCA|nr:signal recognition particle 14 kDa protein [Folsomia candida]OXA42640.1 Signal recognition particle 14 kDa protein [Folsomia candida]
MVLLDNDAFLTELTRLFQKSKTKGSGTVNITMKRYDGTTGPTPKPEGTPVPKKIAKLKAAAMKKNRPDAPAGCLVRACLHNKKISTVVVADNVPKFQLTYCAVLRGSMDSLKRVKKSKNKAKASSS